MIRTFLIPLILLLLTSCKNSEEPISMTFVAYGDLPYKNNDYSLYESLIKNINASEPSLVIHVGDAHAENSCSDKNINLMLNYMNDFVAPLLYTPGDNDWTDCAKYADYNPVERLNYLRQTHYSAGVTLGAQPLPVSNQIETGYPENMRLVKDNIGFITVHVVGSYNNMITSDASRMMEFYSRNKANLAWLDESFKALNNTDAIVVALHASMFEKRLSLRKIVSDIKKNKRLLLSFKTYQRASVGVIQKLRSIFKVVDYKFALPFREIGESIKKNSLIFKKPVLLLHGDTHNHRTYQPFKKNYPYLHAIETYGSPDIKAIEIAIKPKSKNPFKVERVFNP